MLVYVGLRREGRWLKNVYQQPSKPSSQLSFDFSIFLADENGPSFGAAP